MATWRARQPRRQRRPRTARSRTSTPQPASFDSLADPRTMVERALRLGLTHLAITDHERIDGAQRAVELAGDRLHGHRGRGGPQPRRRPHRPLPASAPCRPGYERRRDRGGHPRAGRPRGPAAPLRWLPLPPAAAGPVRPRSDSTSWRPWWTTWRRTTRGPTATPTRMAAAFAARHALPGVASSDAHSVMELGIASTILPGTLHDRRRAAGAAAAAPSPCPGAPPTTCASGRPSPSSCSACAATAASGQRPSRPASTATCRAGTARADRTGHRRTAPAGDGPGRRPARPTTRLGQRRPGVGHRGRAGPRAAEAVVDYPLVQRGPRGGRGAHRQAAARPAHAGLHHRPGPRPAAVRGGPAGLPARRARRLRPGRRPGLAAGWPSSSTTWASRCAATAGRSCCAASAPASGCATRRRSSSSAGSSTASCRPSWVTSTGPGCSRSTSRSRSRRPSARSSSSASSTWWPSWCWASRRPSGRSATGMSDTVRVIMGIGVVVVAGPRGGALHAAQLRRSASSIGCPCRLASSGSTTASRRASSRSTGASCRWSDC